MGSAPDKMCVTADTVAFRFAPEVGVELLLIERGNPPYKGQWALPGGFVKLDEDLPDAARRELKEETGAEPRVLVQAGTWGKPGRDPRGRTVTVAYLAVMDADTTVEGGTDAAVARWHDLNALPDLAFDHADILRDTRSRLIDLCFRTHLAFAFLQEEFTISDLEEFLSALTDGEMRRGDPDSIVERARLVESRTSAPEVTSMYRCAAGDYLCPLEG